MKNYVEHTADGRIISTGVCQDEAVAYKREHSEFIVTETEVNYPAIEGKYFDGLAVVSMVGKPSPNCVFNYTTKTWEDPRTLADIKEAKWSEIKKARDATEYGGVTFAGIVFDSDAESQRRISGAVNMAMLAASAEGTEFSISWTAQDNSVVPLDGNGMIGLGMAVAQHVSTQHTRARLLRETIETASTIEEVNNITWS